ncbi:MAG: hypothetical protein E5Y30_08920 [Mesorhizobium sp.]|nr:MAG: hypothetical protein E5Y30_08920 [Mesorhizobium sp.]
MNVREMLDRQAERLRFQIERQTAEGLPDYARLAASLEKIERDIEALNRLFDGMPEGGERLCAE